MNLPKIRYASLLIAVIVSSLVACGGGSGGGGSGGGSGTVAATLSCDTNLSTDKDSDGDGLSDCYEVKIGTSPADQDSDGDGLTDFDEVVTKAFDATINNFQFNPRVADIPEISVQLQNLPDISVNFTDSSSTSQTRSLTNGTRNSTTLTTSDTYEQSIGEEVSGTVGSSASFPGFGISSSVTYSQNQQETMSWTNTQSSENERFRENTSSETSESGVSNSSGDINVLVKVRNRGHQTITLSNMTLTALQVSSSDPTIQKLVSGMDYDTSAGAFPSFDIAPNAESNSLPFRATLTLAKTYDLLRDSRNLSIEPTTWNITDQDGRSYTHNLTNVGTRAAKVVIDYAGAGNREIEYHYVATVTDFQKNRISAATALADILNVEYTEGSNSSTFSGTQSGLLSIRNVANDDTVNGRWIMVHHYLDTDTSPIKARYDIAEGSYSLADIDLAKGETLHLMYLEDKDGDGVGSREEFLHGTSDNNPDTDGDDLSDFDEIKGGWEVPVTKLLSRKVFSDPTIKDADNDGLEDGGEKSSGTNPHIKDTDNDGILDVNDTALVTADMQETAFLPLAQNGVNDSSINGSVGVTGNFSHASDRFGNANAAANFVTGGDQMDVSNMFTANPAHGATLVMWIKVDPTLPVGGWNLYEQAGSATAILNNSADHHFIVFPDGFQIFADPFDRHSFFPIQNTLFSTLTFADWHMLAMVGEAETVGGGMSKFTVYFDGQVYGEVTNAPDLEFFTAPWKFAGPSSYGIGGEYIGLLDDIRFFKRSLDSQEVKMLYESQQ